MGAPCTHVPNRGTRLEERQATMAGQKIRIRLKAYDHEAIDASARKIVETVTRTGARVVGPVPLPTEKNVYCVIRSPHKYKDSREHFEMRTHLTGAPRGPQRGVVPDSGAVTALSSAPVQVCRCPVHAVGRVAW